MGFSWATCFPQSASNKLHRESLPPLWSQPLNRLTDRSYAEVLPCQDNTTNHYAYIDDLGILGCNRIGVEEAVMSAKSHLESAVT